MLDQILKASANQTVFILLKHHDLGQKYNKKVDVQARGLMRLNERNLKSKFDFYQ